MSVFFFYKFPYSWCLEELNYCICLGVLVKDGLKFLGSWLASARLHVLIDVCYASRLETVIATVLAIRSKFERLANHVTGCLVEQLCALNSSKLALIQGLRDRKWSEIACKCKCRACNGFSCGLWNKYQPGWRLLEGVGGGEVGFERWKTRKSLVRKKPEKQRGKSLTVKSKSICLLKMKIGFYGLDLQGWLVKYEGYEDRVACVHYLYIRFPRWEARRLSHSTSHTRYSVW